MTLGPKVVSIVIMFVLLLPIVQAQVQDEERMFSFLTGDDGILAQFITFGKDNYVQYFAALISIAFVVGAGVKAALRHGPLGGVLQDDRQRTGIAAIVGIGVANGLFFLLRGIENVNSQAAVLWGGFFSLIGIAGMIIIPIWMFMRFGGGGGEEK